MSRPFDEIIAELASAVDNPLNAFVTKEEEREIAETLSTVSGLPAFLKQTMEADVRRYFNAAPEEQKMIKGAFTRTAYLLSLTVPRQNKEATMGDFVRPKRRSLREL